MTETTKRTTKVWAHRGASGYRPENTLEAFELAIRQGADGIELDVHTSVDGELIVMHDENVDRVTDGIGPVSYTHLDVYKRQMYYHIKGRRHHIQ